MFHSIWCFLNSFRRFYANKYYGKIEYYSSSCLVQSKGSKSRANFSPASFWVSIVLCCETEHIPFTRLIPKLLIHCDSSTITWITFLQTKLNLKVCKSFGIDPRKSATPFHSFQLSTWYHVVVLPPLFSFIKLFACKQKELATKLLISEQSIFFIFFWLTEAFFKEQRRVFCKI